MITGKHNTAFVAQALRFYGSDGVTVTGITIQNSQQVHLKFDDCNNVQVSSIEISSPGDSPNTDGIHLQNTQNVLIYNANLACGNFPKSKQRIFSDSLKKKPINCYSLLKKKKPTFASILCRR